MNLIKLLQASYSTDILPLEFINSVLKDKSENAKKALLKRACNKGNLIRLRNGLYLLGDDSRRGGYSIFQIANLMVEPSYVSLESAFSFYGLIPERVYTTTSVTTRANLEQNSPIGQFSFSHLKLNYFNFGFYQIKEGNHHFLIATPLKALMDYIVLMKKKYKFTEEIEEDIRFDFDEFYSFKNFVNSEKINELLNVYKSQRMQRILKDIGKKL